MTNLVKTGVLLAVLTAVFAGTGYLIAGRTGMAVALLMAGASNALAYWNSGAMLLRLYGAREVSRASDPELHGLVAGLARRADLPVPRVYRIDSPQPNAFATGRNPDAAAVAVTTGLLAMLTREELAGVIAHELAHIQSRDTLIMTVAASVAGAVAALADMGRMFGGGARDEHGREGPGPVVVLLLVILAPLAALLVQMAISRTREYEADRVGAGICGQPNWLADALLRIHQGVRQFANPAAERHPATAHLFIVNPLLGGLLGGLFATHPSTGERVRRLRAMPGGAGGAIGRVARAASPTPGPRTPARGL
jgi:heat shock protein HtpX